jgi:hypothetical protein
MNMKQRIAAFAVLGFVSLSLLGAQTILSPLVPKDAKSMATGGAFTSLSSGFEGLYGNPASFAADKGQFTLLTLSTWAYVRPTEANIAKVEALADGSASDQEMLGTINDFVVDNGLGAGFSGGLGFVGKGLGIGAYVAADTVASGPSAMGATMDSAAVANVVLGLGFPLKFGGLRLDLGGDVRPFYRIDSAGSGWAFSEFLGALMGGDQVEAVLMRQKVSSGFGLAMDFGGKLSWKSLSFGLSVRDLVPSYQTTQGSVQDLVNQLSSGNLPTAGDSNLKFLPTVNAGLSWSPRLVPHFIEPSFCLEVQDPVSVISDKDSFWNLIHVGGELKLLSFISLRAGLNKGWASAGFGLNLIFMEIDGAAFTEELGSHPGDAGRSGIALTAALHI